MRQGPRYDACQVMKTMLEQSRWHSTHNFTQTGVRLTELHHAPNGLLLSFVDRLVIVIDTPCGEGGALAVETPMTMVCVTFFRHVLRVSTDGSRLVLP